MEVEERSRSREPPTPHEDHEWEAQKENFRQCYIEEKMTLKEAAACMVERHRFHATTRQWERKVNQWAFNKYESREARIKQISVGGPLDRNSRRFLRRHSRTRERSVSVGAPSLSRGNSESGRPRAISNASADHSEVDFANLGDGGQNNHQFSNVHIANEGSHRRFSHPPPDMSNHFPDLELGQQFQPMPNEITYDVLLPPDALDDLTSSHPPQGFHLDVLRAEPNSHSNVQITVTNEAFAATGETPHRPEIHLNVYDEESSQYTSIPFDYESHATGIPQLSSSHAGLSIPSANAESQFGTSEGGFDFDREIGPTNGQKTFDLSSVFDPSSTSSWTHEMISSQNPVMPDSSFNSEIYTPGGLEDVAQTQSQMSQDFIEPFADLGIHGSQEQFQMPYINPTIQTEASNKGIESPNLVAPVTLPDPYQIDPLFIEFTGEIWRLVANFVQEKNPPAEAGKLAQDINTQRIEFANLMKANVDALVRGLNNIHANDRDTCRNLRQMLYAERTKLSAYQQIMNEKGINPEAEMEVRSHGSAMMGNLSQNIYNTMS